VQNNSRNAFDRVCTIRECKPLPLAPDSWQDPVSQKYFPSLSEPIEVDAAELNDPKYNRQN